MKQRKTCKQKQKVIIKKRSNTGKQNQTKRNESSSFEVINNETIQDIQANSQTKTPQSEITPNK